MTAHRFIPTQPTPRPRPAGPDAVLLSRACWKVGDGFPSIGAVGWALAVAAA